MPGPILFCDSWNLKEAETRPDLGFFYNTYIPIFSTILEVEILPILVLRGAFNRRKSSSQDFLGGRKGGSRLVFDNIASWVEGKRKYDILISLMGRQRFYRMTSSALWTTMANKNLFPHNYRHTVRRNICTWTDAPTSPSTDCALLRSCERNCNLQKHLQLLQCSIETTI